MKTLTLLSLTGFTVVALLVSCVDAQKREEAQSAAIASAATDFLRSLDDQLRAKVSFPFPAGKAVMSAKFKGGMNGQMNFIGEKYGDSVWSNFPVSDVPRPGLQISQLNERQRKALMRVLETALSSQGYQKIIDIMDSDQVLSEGGTHYSAGTKYYTVGIFGQPSRSEPWMLQFGGHHLGLSLVMAKGRGAMTPTLTGAQPALFLRNGKPVRPLLGENDKAFDLLDSLTAEQRKQAILAYSIGDLVLGPGHFGDKILPEGLKGRLLTAQQKVMFLSLINEWVGITNNIYSTERLNEIKASLDETYFAWSGPTTHETGKNGSAYYRIQGPKLIIEFSPQETGGDSTLHIHTMYRDPTNDYGRDLIQE